MAKMKIEDRIKFAILQVADSGPLESLVCMLQTAGYKCYLPNKQLTNRLRELGCDTVLNVEDLVRTPSYEQPMKLESASIEDMSKADLYVDVKAHRNGPKIWQQWPNLKEKTLWYRINGAYPEHVITSSGIDHGNEVDPPCPILTPNMWYSETKDLEHEGFPSYKEAPWKGRAYACWPPFYRWHEYDERNNRINSNRNLVSQKIKYDHAICLINNLDGWGYGALRNRVHDLGIDFYGSRERLGELPHEQVKTKLKTAIAMVHLKSNDAPGYALYEAIAAGCPLIVPRRLIWRSHMESLLIPGETCLVFDRPTHDSMIPDELDKCYEEIRYALWELDTPHVNRKIATAARDKLKSLMWKPNRLESTKSFKQFMTKHFGY